MLTTVHPTLNDHEYNMRPACVVYAVWCYFVPESSTLFSQVPWSVLWLCHQFVTDVTAWLLNPNMSWSKNRKEKKRKKKKKKKKKNKVKGKMKFTINDLDIRKGRKHAIVHCAFVFSWLQSQVPILAGV